MGLVDKIISFETGEMSEDDIIIFFQELIDSEKAWSLQGSYGRLAKELIVLGHCHPKYKEV